MANGKAQAHFHEQLKELKCNQKAIQEELLRRREEVEASTSKPAVPSQLTTPQQKGLVNLIGPGMLRASQWMAWKGLPQWVPEALGDTKIPPSEGGANIPSTQEGAWSSGH